MILSKNRAVIVPDMVCHGMNVPERWGLLDAYKTLEETGISLIDEPTPKAVDTFNKLKKSGKKVAGAFHLTC